MDKYPPKMLLFIERNAGRVDPSRLSEVVQAAVASGTAHTVDWDHLYLPPIAGTSTSSYNASTNNNNRKGPRPPSGSPPPPPPPPSSSSKGHQRSSQHQHNPMRQNNQHSGNQATGKKRPGSDKDNLIPSAAKRAARLARFGSPATNEPKVYSDHLIRGPVEGSNQTLEKPFRRLTAQVAPEHVRPLDVLKRAFDQFGARYAQDGNYDFWRDQLMSIRQDLKVQHIQNEFTALVYETHARVALSNSDWAQFKTALAGARETYCKNWKQLSGNAGEIWALEILYALRRSQWETVSSLERQVTVTQPDLGTRAEVRAALAIVHAYNRSERRLKFLRLASRAPDLLQRLVDPVVKRERLNGLLEVAKVSERVDPKFAVQVCGFAKQDELSAFLEPLGVQVAAINERGLSRALKSLPS